MKAKYIALILCCAPTWADAVEPPTPMPAGYNEAGPRPAKYLSLLLAGLRKTLKDPYSIRDLVVCEPTRFDASYDSILGWQRAYWYSSISLNAKNSYGGYTGSRNGSVTFRLGEEPDVYMRDEPKTAFAAELDAATAKVLARCPTIPQKTVEALLAH